MMGRSKMAVELLSLSLRESVGSSTLHVRECLDFAMCRYIITYLSPVILRLDTGGIW
jgi:hypothetical protein